MMIASVCFLFLSHPRCRSTGGPAFRARFCFSVFSKLRGKAPAAGCNLTAPPSRGCHTQMIFPSPPDSNLPRRGESILRDLRSAPFSVQLPRRGETVSCHRHHGHHLPSLPRRGVLNVRPDKLTMIVSVCSLFLSHPRCRSSGCPAFRARIMFLGFFPAARKGPCRRMQLDRTTLPRMPYAADLSFAV